jgi:nucleotide-binding universal stress UspA family protein
MKNILVAVDMQKGDQILIDHASALASRFDSKVWIVHVAAPDPDFVGYDAGPVYIRKTLADELRTEHKSLHTYSKTLHALNISAESLLVQGPTVQTIFDEANKLACDLLILGSHKHNFLKRVFGQEVTREIFEKSKIPMLIVPLGE